VGAAFRRLAGPPVRRVGLFAGRHKLAADLPRPRASGHEWGRALSRLRFDALLLAQAREAGMHIRQPAKVQSVSRRAGLFHCGVESLTSGMSEVVAARIVVGAHGSWHPGTLVTQPPRRPAAASDLLGFKCHFHDGTLAPGLMPLLAFPGGYGGMVRCEDNLVSLSCCLRRDQLTALRGGQPRDAGETVLRHIQEKCAGVREALASARPVGPWLAAGPIRPGARAQERHGVFLVGNAAGEAHPAIAEGISIALQSAWLLSGKLIAWKRRGGAATALDTLAGSYAADWQRHFGYRLHLSDLVANWAMRPAAVGCMLPLLRLCPGILTWFARLSGKSHNVVR
jgi:menaquinone-9 beta-reductase